MVGFNPGGSSNGIGANLGGLMGSTASFKQGGGFLKSLSDMFSSKGFGNALELGSLGLQGFGLHNANKIAEGQLDILGQQENRAATAQNLNTGHNLSLALQTTTPGTPEHERIKQAIADQSFAV